MPPGVSVTPRAVVDGETLSYAVTGLPPELAGESLQITLVGSDAVAEGMWIGSLGAVIAPDGTATAQYEPGLMYETVVWANRLEVPNADPQRVWDNPKLFADTGCVINGATGPVSAAEVNAIAKNLESRRRQRYDTPLGDPALPGATEYRVLCVVEQLRMTTNLRIPGGEILATSAANTASDEVNLLNALASDLDGHAPIPADWWVQQSQSGRPWTVVRFPSVWAATPEEAAQLAWNLRDRLLHILALNRGASGNPLVTYTAEVETGKGGAFYEAKPYVGNLAGGLIAGEDQHWLLIQEAAVQADPALALATRLYREATAEMSVDARYFRFWGLLETLSLNRIGEGHTVTRLDGTPWPGQHATTDSAAPRVFEMLRRLLLASATDEASLAGPASSLEEAVRGWYARRNATAHYGAFDPHDPLQQAKTWFPRALAIHNAAHAAGGLDEWQRTLRNTTAAVIHHEIGSVGRPLML